MKLIDGVFSSGQVSAIWTCAHCMLLGECCGQIPVAGGATCFEILQGVTCPDTSRKLRAVFLHVCLVDGINLKKRTDKLQTQKTIISKQGANTTRVDAGTKQSNVPKLKRLSTVASTDRVLHTIHQHFVKLLQRCVYKNKIQTRMSL